MRDDGRQPVDSLAGVSGGWVSRTVSGAVSDAKHVGHAVSDAADAVGHLAADGWNDTSTGEKVGIGAGVVVTGGAVIYHKYKGRSETDREPGATQADGRTETAGKETKSGTTETVDGQVDPLAWLKKLTGGESDPTATTAVDRFSYSELPIDKVAIKLAGFNADRLIDTNDAGAMQRCVNDIDRVIADAQKPDGVVNQLIGKGLLNPDYVQQLQKKREALEAAIGGADKDPRAEAENDVAVHKNPVNEGIVDAGDPVVSPTGKPQSPGDKADKDQDMAHED